MPDLINQGVDLMLYGMGVVFVFLTLLVVVTQLMSASVSRFLPDAAVIAKPSRKPVAPAAPVSLNDPRIPDQKTLAILQAAVDQHRGRTK